MWNAPHTRLGQFDVESLTSLNDACSYPAQKIKTRVSPMSNSGSKVVMAMVVLLVNLAVKMHALYISLDIEQR